MRVERDKRDVKALRLLLRPDGGGDGNDILELPGRKLLPDALHGEVSSGARAEADDHAGLDVVVDGFVADEFLQLVLGEAGGSHEGPGEGRASGRGYEGGGESPAVYEHGGKEKSD